MNIVDIINKKRINKALTKDEIEYVINGYLGNEIKDYQVSSLLMAICLNGMNDSEIFYLTDAMLNSGEIIDLSQIKEIKVDKHSTGGVGDKTTIALLPLVASCGVYVPKMSGRGLGFTGGTVDKFESIKGFKSNLTSFEFIKQIKAIKVADIAQSEKIVPADKKLYALRDVTGTASSLPLIASSIMSKKLASGADKIVIDIKIGSGALIKNTKDGYKLANIMITIGKKYDKEVTCVLTDMSQPLGLAIGNSLEVLEAIDVLKGNGPEDITNLVLVLASIMVSKGLGITAKQADKLVIDNLTNGKAYDKLNEMVKSQGGDLNSIKVSDNIISIKSPKTGFVRSIKTNELGEIVRKLGGGRYEKDDIIDNTVGIVLSVKRGDYVLEDEELLKVYVNKKDIVINDILSCFDIGNTSTDAIPLVYKIVE